MSIIQLTTVLRVKRRLGKIAVDLRTDDADGVNTADELASQCVDDASAEVWGYLQLNYPAAEIEASDWIELRTRDIACAYFCERRGNDMPASVRRAFDHAMTRLELAQMGGFMVPDARPVRGMAPTAVNLREQLRPTPHAVVSRQRSPQALGVAEGYTQRRDEIEELLDFSI